MTCFYFYLFLQFIFSGFKKTPLFTHPTPCPTLVQCLNKDKVKNYRESREPLL